MLKRNFCPRYLYIDYIRNNRDICDICNNQSLRIILVGQAS